MKVKFDLDYLLVCILLLVIIIQLSLIRRTLSKEVEVEQMEAVRDSAVDLSVLELTEDNFFYVCDYYDILFPEIVYAQAKLESGHFTSSMCRNKNNCLGLYDSVNHEYYKFNHWSECLHCYKDFVQRKYKSGDYYTFLEELPYASDSTYVSKVKFLANKF